MSPEGARRPPLPKSGRSPAEELDAAAVDAWLKPRVAGLAGTPRVTPYVGGASNWTYRLEYDSHDLVLRRPPAGTKARSSHDMKREYRVQDALRPAFPRVPEMVAFCDDPAVIGTDFYVMKRVAGLVPRSRIGGAADASAARRLCLSFVETFVALHRVDPSSVGLDTLGKGAGYARRQVAGWTERYANARTWNVPRFARVTAWLAERVPDDAGSCVIHNDFRLDNLVVDPEDPSRILAVLDWEMATVGDPLMDLGCSLAYWVEAGDDPVAKSTRRQPTHLPGMLTRRELCETYLEKAGRPAQDLTFYEVFGVFRLAAIAQQIYFRYHRKETRNPAFRRFWMLTHYLEWRCRRLIHRSSRT